MSWMCGLLSFLWFCPNTDFISTEALEGHIKFFSELDTALSAPEEICPSIVGDAKLQFQGIAHLVYDERLALVGKIDVKVFTPKVSTCLEDCSCGALLTLEDKVVGLRPSQSENLKAKQDQLTDSYYESCQNKIQLDCESPLVKKISKKAEL